MNWEQRIKEIVFAGSALAAAACSTSSQGSGSEAGSDASVDDDAGD